MHAASAPAPQNAILNATVIVAALGYFVDIYDMLIFNITRVKSLTDIGLSGDALTDAGIFILNMQLLGFLAGGLMFGILGDKLGRKKALMGSILLYSAATLGCAFVQTADQYAVLRFLAGLGLAGEIGVGVTLVCEAMPREKRGLGVTVFSVVGISGAIFAALISELISWRTAYVVGGVAGFAVLLTRGFVFESGLFEKTRAASDVVRGSMLTILRAPRLMVKYVCCVMLGAPIFFVVGVIWTLAPEIGRALGATAPLSAPIAIATGYAALMIGDGLAGVLSQKLQSRKKVIYIFLTACTVLLGILFSSRGFSPAYFYVLTFFLGISIGFWVNLILLASEQFGTNIRATAATSIPNFARATLLPVNMAIAALKPDYGILTAVTATGLAAIGLTFLCIAHLEETFHKDLDYTE